MVEGDAEENGNVGRTAIPNHFRSVNSSINAGGRYDDDEADSGVEDETTHLLLYKNNQHEVSVSDWEECKSIFKLGWVVSAATIFRLSLGMTDVAFLGHLGDDELSAAALASSIFVIVCLLPYGSAVALNTLCSQAYGAGNYHLVGEWLQVAVFVITMFTVPAVVILVFTREILAPFVANPRVLDLAQEFAYVSASRILPVTLYCAIRQYFQAQQIVMPATIVSLATVGVNVGLNFIFIHGAFGWEGLGFKGSPLATFVSLLFQLVVFVLYTVYWRGMHKKTWGGWTLKAFKRKRLIEFGYLAAPMSVSLLLDEGMYQGLQLLAGHITDDAASAQGILFQLWGMLWAIWWGIGMAVQVRMGTFLGANDPKSAKHVLKVGAMITATFCAVAGVATYFLRSYLFEIYTGSDGVTSLMHSVFLFYVLVFGVQIMSMMFGCVVDVTGRPGINMVVTVVCSWFVILPLSYVFAFVLDYDLHGLWDGCLIGEVLRLLILCAAVLRTDWAKMAARALQRSEGNSSATCVTSQEDAS